jgi:DNA primase
MKKRGYNEKALNDCNAKVTYNNSYPIIFPMLDNGKFKGWVCRTTNKEVEKKRKYLYNAGFSRATTLVGDYGNADYLFVVEGYMDRLRFLQNGYKENVVAILGWKMSKEQQNKIKKAGIKYIISALDNDECGEKGTRYLKSIFPNVIRFKHIKGIKDTGEMSDEKFRKAYNYTMKELAQYKRKR